MSIFFFSSASVTFCSLLVSSIPSGSFFWSGICGFSEGLITFLAGTGFPETFALDSLFVDGGSNFVSFGSDFYSAGFCADCFGSKSTVCDPFADFSFSGALSSCF